MHLESASSFKHSNLLRPRGFSLVELMVVMIIVGFLMSLGVGVWLSLRQRMDVEGCAVSMVNILKQAMADAVEGRTNSSVELIVDYKQKEVNAKGTVISSEPVVNTFCVPAVRTPVPSCRPDGRRLSAELLAPG